MIYVPQLSENRDTQFSYVIKRFLIRFTNLASDWLINFERCYNVFILIITVTLCQQFVTEVTILHVCLLMFWLEMIA